MEIDTNIIEQALRLLGEILEQRNSPRINLVVCGGAALIGHGWVERTTHDVDIVALLDENSGDICSPAPLPEFLLDAAHDVAETIGLENDWLNNGPSRGEGGLYQVGLPEGLKKRLALKDYGPKLTVGLIGRFDLICLKTLAAATQGPGRHFNDLEVLEPTTEELESAAEWAISQDPSPGFHKILTDMLRVMNHNELAERI